MTLSETAGYELTADNAEGYSEEYVIQGNRSAETDFNVMNLQPIMQKDIQRSMS